MFKYRILLLSLWFSSTLSAESTKSLKQASAHLKLGLFSIGAEANLEEENQTWFLNVQREGFLFAGTWTTILLGMKLFHGPHFFSKWGIGWYSTQTFVYITRHGPTASAVIGLEFPLSNSSWYWGLEFGGAGINYLLTDHEISGFLHVPALYVGKKF